MRRGTPDNARLSPAVIRYSRSPTICEISPLEDIDDLFANMGHCFGFVAGRDIHHIGCHLVAARSAPICSYSIDDPATRKTGRPARGSDCRPYAGCAQRKSVFTSSAAAILAERAKGRRRIGTFHLAQIADRHNRTRRTAAAMSSPYDDAASACGRPIHPVAKSVAACIAVVDK